MASNSGAEILTKPRFTLLQASKIYSELRREVTEAGILDRDYIYYAWTTFVSLFCIFSSLFFLVVSTSFTSTVIWSFVFILFSIQLSGLFHDAGHRAVFKSAFYNDIFGNFISTLANVAYPYWMYKHNKHHASPNELEEDPDIEIPFISFTSLKRQPNLFEQKLKRYQAYLYFPFGVFALLYFKYKSVLFFKDNYRPSIIWNILLFLISGFVWYIFPFYIFEFWKAVLVILVVNFGVGLYLMNIFAPNHKGMPQIVKGAKFTFLEQQIVTARNVKSNWFLDILFIGLNYQIEHHLFPNCPRNKLGQITPFVLEICKKYNLEYSEVSLLETNKIILTELAAIAVAS